MKRFLAFIPTLLFLGTTPVKADTPIHIQITTVPDGNRTITLTDDRFSHNGAITINATWALGEPASVTYHDGPTGLWYEEDGSQNLTIVFAVYASRANFTMDCPWNVTLCTGDFSLEFYNYPWSG